MGQLLKWVSDRIYSTTVKSMLWKRHSKKLRVKLKLNISSATIIQHIFITIPIVIVYCHCEHRTISYTAIAENIGCNNRW